MKKILAIAVALTVAVFMPFLLNADTVTITIQFPTDPNALYANGSGNPITVAVPQFDSTNTPGTLRSVSYAFADAQTIAWGWNDMYIPAWQQFLVYHTAEDYSPLFDEYTSPAFTDVETTTGGRQVHTGEIEQDTVEITESGTFTPDAWAQATADGVWFTPYPSVSVDANGRALGVFAAVIGVRDVAYLAVTYTYTLDATGTSDSGSQADPALAFSRFSAASVVATPEPSGLWLMLWVIAVGLSAYLGVCIGTRIYRFIAGRKRKIALYEHTT